MHGIFPDTLFYFPRPSTYLILPLFVWGGGEWRGRGGGVHSKVKLLNQLKKKKKGELEHVVISVTLAGQPPLPAVLLLMQ